MGLGGIVRVGDPHCDLPGYHTHYDFFFKGRTKKSDYSAERADLLCPPRAALVVCLPINRGGQPRQSSLPRTGRAALVVCLPIDCEGQPRQSSLPTTGRADGRVSPRERQEGRRHRCPRGADALPLPSWRPEGRPFRSPLGAAPHVFPPTAGGKPLSAARFQTGKRFRPPFPQRADTIDCLSQLGGQKRYLLRTRR